MSHGVTYEYVSPFMVFFSGIGTAIVAAKQSSLISSKEIELASIEA
jgi:hypothetical protein